MRHRSSLQATRMHQERLQEILTTGSVSEGELSDFIVLALYDAMPETLEGDSISERLCALFLHYADAYEPYKAPIRNIYSQALISPREWPLTHLWNITGQWMRLAGIKENIWNQGVMSFLSQRVAQAWFAADDENVFLQHIDEMTRQTTHWML